MQRDLIDNALTADEATTYSLAVLSYPENQDYLFQILDFLPSHDLLIIQSTASQFNTVVSHLLLWQKFNANQSEYYPGHYLGKYLLPIDWQMETRTISDIITERIHKKMGASINLKTAFTLYPKFFQSLAIFNANQLMGLVNEVRAQAIELQQNKIYYHPTTHTFTYPSEANAQQILHYLHTAKQLESLLLKLVIYSETYPLAAEPLSFNPIFYRLTSYQPKSGLSFKEVVEMDVFFGYSPQYTVKLLLTKWKKINAKPATARSTKEKHKITIIEDIFQTVTRKDILDAQSLGLFSEGNNDASHFSSPLLRLVDHLREEEILTLVKTIPIYNIPNMNILGFNHLFNKNSYFIQKASLSLKLQTILSTKYPSRQIFEQLLVELKQLKHTESEKLLHDILDNVIDRSIFLPPALNFAQPFKDLSNEQRLASTLQKFLAADMSNERVISSIENLAKVNENFKAMLINSHAMLVKLCDYYKEPAQNIKTLPKLLMEGLTAKTASRVAGALVGSLLGSLFWLITYPILVLGIALVPLASISMLVNYYLDLYDWDKFGLGISLLIPPLSLFIALSSPILAFAHLPFLIKDGAELGYKTGLLLALKNTFKLPWLISQESLNRSERLFSIGNILSGLLTYIRRPVDSFFAKPINGGQINSPLCYYHQLKSKLEAVSAPEQPISMAITPKMDNSHSMLQEEKKRSQPSSTPVSQTIKQFGIFAVENSSEIKLVNCAGLNNSYRV